MAYAVFKTGGKQYRVQEGDTLDIEKLEGEVDGEVQFAEVLLVNDGSATTVGTPLVEGAAVTAKVLDQFRGPKGKDSRESKARGRGQEKRGTFKHNWRQWQRN